jgi:hypothetical protein
LVVELAVGGVEGGDVDAQAALLARGVLIQGVDAAITARAKEEARAGDEPGAGPRSYLQPE